MQDGAPAGARLGLCAALMLACSAGARSLALLALLAFVAPASAAAPTPAAPSLVSSRERAGHHLPVDADQYPRSSIGKLYNSIGGACTAVVVASERVLTAAHCLYNYRARRFLQADAIHVLLGYARGRYRIHARVAAIGVGPDYDPGRELGTGDSDWAVLTLVAPLPDDVRPIAAAAQVPAAGTAIVIGGFPQDRAFLMTADTRCRLLGTVEGGRLLSHDCVIQHGDSGAPLLVDAGRNTVELFGIAVGFLTSVDRRVSIAAPFIATTLDRSHATR